MVLIAIALFIGFCWLASGWLVRDKSKKHYRIKRGALFLIPALMPVYIQVVEYVLFRQACNEAVVYFPEEKLPAPSVLITLMSNKKNQGKYFDGMFKYIVAPHYMNNRPVDLTQPIAQFNDYIVYPSKLKPLEGHDRERVLDDVRYLLVLNPAIELDTWYSYSSDIYIYI